MAMGIGIRAGLAVGSLSAAVLGYERFGYGVWGDAVELATSLCKAATLNTTACSTATRNLLPTAVDTIANEPGRHNIVRFRFEHRGEQVVTGACNSSQAGHTADDMHTLLEREQLPGKEGGSASSLSGRASTRNLVSVEIGWTPTPDPAGIHHSPLPGSPELTVPHSSATTSSDQGLRWTLPRYTPRPPRREQEGQSYRRQGAEGAGVSVGSTAATTPRPPLSGESSYAAHESGGRRGRRIYTRTSVPQKTTSDGEVEEVAGAELVVEDF